MPFVSTAWKLHTTTVICNAPSINEVADAWTITVTHIIRQFNSHTVQVRQGTSLESALSLHHGYCSLLRRRFVENAALQTIKWLLPRPAEVHSVEDNHKRVGSCCWKWKEIKILTEYITKIHKWMKKNPIKGVVLLLSNFLFYFFMKDRHLIIQKDAKTIKVVFLKWWIRIKYRIRVSIVASRSFFKKFNVSERFLLASNP